MGRPKPKELFERFPDSTLSECERFAAVSKNEKDASIRIEKYMEWRSRVDCLTTEQVEQYLNKKDSEIWDESLQKSLRMLTTGANIDQRTNALRGTNSEDIILSSDKAGQVIFTHKYKSGDDDRTFIQVLPARIMMSAENSSQVYIDALSMYLDTIFDRNCLSKAVVLIDVRAGRGWPNPPAHKMIGFIRRVASELQDLFPQRLERCILFPVPNPAIFLWKVVKNVLDKTLVDQVILIPGNAGSKAKPPNACLREFVDDRVLETMEQKRLASFNN